MFIWDKGVLNEEQERAICDENSVLLIASPGSGKTRVLTYKIAYELSRLKSNKEYIIAITYTNRAADEIKERVEILGVNVSQLWIGTIHSFCLEWILRPYSLYLEELVNGFCVLNSHASEELITKLCVPYKKQRITYWDCGFIYNPNGFKLTSLESYKHDTINFILKEYFKILRDNNQIDFEQILHYSFCLLKENPIISSILSKLFPFILIDEYQDTKEIQYHIVAYILRANQGKSKTLIVGDPNQSIFDSLGGFPMAKNDLEELFQFHLTEHSLSGNYRSSFRIINYFDFYKTYDNLIVPKGINKDYESVITFNYKTHKSELVTEIVRLILFNINDRKISPNEICIVAPQWVHLASLTRNLMIKLPDYSFDGPGMAPFSRDIDNFWYKLCRIALTEPSPNLYVRRLRWSKEILDDLHNAGVDVTNFTNKTLLKLFNSITIDEINGLLYLKLLFDNICKGLGFDFTVFSTLEEHYNAFFNASKVRIEKLKKDGNEFIDSIESFRKVFKQREGITVSTIHGVKGEEYDTVICFALLQDYVPHFKDRNGEVNAKKMLYVISSRARKNLHLISERGRSKPFGSPPEEYATTIQLEKYKYGYDIV